MDEIKIHEHGFIRLIDSMGSDSRIVQAARVSYGEGAKTPEKDAALIDYLLRNKHWSPFEKVVLEFHVKLPIFLARQWMRHRDSYNEISGRYTELKDEFFIPEGIRVQSNSNKQSSSGYISEDDEEYYGGLIQARQHATYKVYKKMIDKGIAREQARSILPLSTYTEFYWTVNLRSLMNFINLRADVHAQGEIRDYANVILEMIKPIVPNAINSWKNHIKKSVTFSEDEFDVLKIPLGLTVGSKTHIMASVQKSDLSPSRQKELLGKLGISNA